MLQHWWALKTWCWIKEARDKRPWIQFSSVAQSFPTLRPHGLQQARHPCPSPIPGVYSNPCPLSRWHHPTISSCHPLLLNLSQHQCLFQWVSSSHQVAKVLRVSASASVLPVNIQNWSPLGWTDWISLQSKGLKSLRQKQTNKKNLLQHHRSKASILRRSPFFIVQLSHPYRTTGKTTALTAWAFVGKVMSLAFYYAI